MLTPCAPSSTLNFSMQRPLAIHCLCRLNPSSPSGIRVARRVPYASCGCPTRAHANLTRVEITGRTSLASLASPPCGAPRGWRLPERDNRLRLSDHFKWLLLHAHPTVSPPVSPLGFRAAKSGSHTFLIHVQLPHSQRALRSPLLPT